MYHNYNFGCNKIDFVGKGICADWAIHDSENDKAVHWEHRSSELKQLETEIMQMA